MLALVANGYKLTRTTLRDIYEVSFFGWPIIIGLIVMIPVWIFDGVSHLYTKMKLATDRDLP